MKHKLVLIFHLILTVFGFICQAPAQEGGLVPVTGIRVLTLDDIDDGGALLTTWKYHPGDNPEWANPAFDDTGWESTSTLMFRPELPESGWEGIGWFRLRLSIPDERLWNMPLALRVVFQVGASEIYLDGELIYKFGKVGTREEEEKPYWKRDPQVISFSSKTEHLIAIRYSNFSSYQLTPMLGFSLMLSPLNDSIEERVNIVRDGTTLQMVWTAVSIFLMLQHLLLFVFYPRARENFYFALLTGSIGAFVFLTFQFVMLATSTAQLRDLIQLLVCVYVLMLLSGMLFLHTLFYSKLLKLSWLFLIGWIVIACVCLFSLRTLSSDTGILDLVLIGEDISGYAFRADTGTEIGLLVLFTLLTFLEMARVIIVAILKKKDGAWIFGLGSLSPFILTFVLGDLVSQAGYTINWQLGVLSILLAPLFSMSVYLARNFSRTSRKLEREVIERQVLEVENTRKTEELEAAL